MMVMVEGWDMVHGARAHPTCTWRGVHTAELPKKSNEYPSVLVSRSLEALNPVKVTGFSSFENPVSGKAGRGPMTNMALSDSWAVVARALSSVAVLPSAVRLATPSASAPSLGAGAVGRTSDDSPLSVPALASSVGAEAVGGV